MNTVVLANKSELSRWQKVAIGILIVWLLMPTIPLFIWSFSKGWFYPQLLPERWSLDAWRYVFSENSQVLSSFGSSLFGSSGTALMAALIGVPAGRALGMYRFRGKAVVEILMIAPTLVPGIAVILGIHVIFIKIGLANTQFGVMIAHLIPTLPYMTLVMAGVFANYNADYEAQARSLGATHWQVWRHIMFPAILPGIVVGTMFAFVISWSQYILTLLIGGGKVVSVPLLLFQFASSGRNDIAGAICVLYILPGIAIILASFKYLHGAQAIKRFSKV